MSKTTYKSAHRNEKQTFPLKPCPLLHEESYSQRLCVHFGNKKCPSCKKNVKDPVWRGVQLSVLCLKKKLIFNAFDHCTRCGIVFHFTLKWWKYYFGLKLFTTTLILKKWTLLWGTPVHSVKETDVRNLRQGKRRSLRHLNTVKPERLPPTTEQKKPSDLPKPP